MSASRVRAALATKHGKELIFAPAFARIGIDVMVADVDTDEFGTFAGEVERPASALAVVEQKARAALRATSATIGLASEGSFGAHPMVPNLLVDTELVAYVDDEFDHVVIARASEPARIPASATVVEVSDVDGLGIVPLLPDQAAIVVTEETNTGARVVHAKGITEVDHLRELVDSALSKGSGRVIVEPDLRAHHCAARREVIATAVDRLVSLLSRACPACDAPGFGTIRVVPGQRCALCGLPTTRPAVDVLGCTRCGHETESLRPGEADPTHCDRCNP